MQRRNKLKETYLEVKRSWQLQIWLICLVLVERRYVIISYRSKVYANKYRNKQMGCINIKIIQKRLGKGKQPELNLQEKQRRKSAESCKQKGKATQFALSAVLLRRLLLLCSFACFHCSQSQRNKMYTCIYSQEWTKEGVFILVQERITVCPPPVHSWT